MKISGETIRHLFGGDIAAFLRERRSGLWRRPPLVGRADRAATEIEQAVLRWLAVECEPVTFADLANDLGSTLDAVSVLEAVQSLRRRSLLVQRRGYALALSLQSVVLEYVTQRMIDDVGERDRDLAAWPCCSRQALIKATSKEYVRRSQERLIAAPVLERLIALLWRVNRGAKQCLMRLLDVAARAAASRTGIWAWQSGQLAAAVTRRSAWPGSLGGRNPIRRASRARPLVWRAARRARR